MRTLTPAHRHSGAQVSPLVSFTLPDVPPPNTRVVCKSLITMQRLQCVSGFATLQQARHHSPPNRVRIPADRHFASSCSPPRLAATQLLSATGFWLSPARTFTLQCQRLHGRTTKCAARTDFPPCATQRHRGALGAAHTRLRRLEGFAAGAVRRGDLFGGEKRRAGGGTRSVRRQHARRSCLSGGRAAHATSSAALPRLEHRSAVAARRRQPQCEPRRTAPAAKPSA